MSVYHDYYHQCSDMELSTWFFFFKQKTAYEMRISDWTSDVCSSDLCWWSRHATCSTSTASVRFGSRSRSNASTATASFMTTCQIGRASCRERVCQYV